MDGVKLLNVAIFGLSLRTLNQIKSMVEGILADVITVNWTNIANPDLNILLINDMFLESSNIQRLLKNKQMKVLTLVSESKDRHASDIFCLNKMNRNELQEWLERNISYSDSLLDLNDQAHIIIEATSPSKNIKELDHCTTFKDVIQNILNPATGRIKIFDRFGELAICDTRTQWVWVNDLRVKQCSDHSLNYIHARINEIGQYSTKPHHLKLWMWNILWNSPDALSLAPERGCFRLISWPQPAMDYCRKDVFRIATCFALGAEIHQVAKYLDLPPIVIRQFIAASLSLGFVKIISVNEIGLTAEPVINSDQNTVKSFFNRIKAKLGFKW